MCVCVCEKCLKELWSLSSQVDHLHRFIYFRFTMGFVDSLIAKCKMF